MPYPWFAPGGQRGDLLSFIGLVASFSLHCVEHRPADVVGLPLTFAHFPGFFAVWNRVVSSMAYMTLVIRELRTTIQAKHGKLAVVGFEFLSHRFTNVLA